MSYVVSLRGWSKPTSLRDASSVVSPRGMSHAGRQDLEGMEDQITIHQ